MLAGHNTSDMVVERYFAFLVCGDRARGYIRSQRYCSVSS
jgi:hypothetical protein